MKEAKERIIYLAGPFFNPHQLQVIEDLKEIIADCQFTVFSPKDECMFKQGVTTPEEVLNINLIGMRQAELMVVVTDGKDPGTMFESGWAYANQLPIIYAWFSGLPGQKFNLMLGATGSIVRNYAELRRSLHDAYSTGTVVRRNWNMEEILYE